MISNNAQKDESVHGYLARKGEAPRKSSRFAHLNQHGLKKLTALAIPYDFEKREFIKESRQK